MKVEDSGMPVESYWNNLFDINEIVDWLDVAHVKGVIVEIGSGYGTFTVPVAKQSAGKVYAYDIDAAMIDVAQSNARNAGLSNVIFGQRDVLEQGTGLAADSVDRVLLFNILHFSERRVLLKEAARILNVGGIVAILHWRKDVPTPRGPAVDTRPDQEQILAAAAGLHLTMHGSSRILAPFHWGIQLLKEA